MSDLNPALATPSRGFVDLPPEIIEQIARYANPEDLLNLRLVSKYTAASSERPMLKANFKELHIILALPSSLRKALSVTRSEKLRKYIWKVCIYVDRFHRTVISTAPPLYPNQSDGAPSDDTRLEWQQRQKYVPMYKQLLQDQDWLEATGNDERELREVLYQLRSQPGGMYMRINDFQMARAQLPRDFKRLITEYGGKPPMWPEWEHHRPLQIILNAIRESSIPLPAFMCYCRNYGIPLSMFAPKTGFWRVAENFRDIQNFTLKLQAGPGDVDSLSDTKAVSDFVNFLQSMAGNLRLLHLNAEPKDTQEYTEGDLDQIFEMMRTDVHFLRISELILSNVTVDYASFISYLAKHRSTLQQYKFRNVIVKSTGTALTGYHFQQKVLEDLAAADLPAPDPGWYMENGDVPP